MINSTGMQVLAERVRRYWAPFGWEYTDEECLRCAEHIATGATWTQRCSMGDLELTLDRLERWEAGQNPWG